MKGKGEKHLGNGVVPRKALILLSLGYTHEQLGAGAFVPFSFQAGT